MKLYIPVLLIATGFIANLQAMEKSQRFDVQVIDAAKTADVTELKILKALGANFNARDAHFKATALHWVIGNAGLTDEERLNALKFLLENTDIDINGENKEQTTPLAYAVFQHKISLVKELLKHGALVNENAMSYAKALGFTEILEALDKARENKSGPVVSRFLIAESKEVTQSTGAVFQNLDEQVIDAAKRADVSEFKRLKALNANFNAKDALYKANALHWVIGNEGLTDKERLDALKFLLENTNIFIDATNKEGTTPLVFAIYKGKYYLVKELLKHGAFIDETAMFHGKTRGIASILELLENARRK